MPRVYVKLAPLLKNLDTEGTGVLVSALGHLTLQKDPDAFWVGNLVGPELGCIFGEIDCLAFPTLMCPLSSQQAGHWLPIDWAKREIRIDLTAWHWVREFNSQAMNYHYLMFKHL
jgi:hypothetical protein